MRAHLQRGFLHSQSEFWATFENEQSYRHGISVPTAKGQESQYLSKEMNYIETLYCIPLHCLSAICDYNEHTYGSIESLSAVHSHQKYVFKTGFVCV